CSSDLRGGKLESAWHVKPGVRDRDLIFVKLVSRQEAREISSVRRAKRNRLVGTPALNKFAPFHVVEEESLLLVWIVELPKSDRAGDVEAKNVKTKLLSRSEGVFSIESIIAIEFPG